MKNNFKEILNILKWPILFWIGQFLILLIVEFFYSFFADVNNFNNFINKNSYILSTLYLIIILPILKKYYKEENKINYNTCLKVILLAFILSLTFNILIVLIKIYLNIKMVFNPNVYILINTIIIGPILEEYLFRGIVFNKFKNIVNEDKACLFTSIIFGLIHLNIISIIYTFIMGFIMNKIYIKYKSITYSICFHITINFVASLIIPIVVNMSI